MNSIIMEPTFEKVALERLRVQVNNYVSRHAILSTHESPDRMLDGITVQLRSEVLAQKLDNREYSRTVHFEEPASTWQMFKRTHSESWWLGWLVERRPVRTVRHSQTVTVTAETSAIYPDARITLPERDFGSPYIVTRMVPQ